MVNATRAQVAMHLGVVSLLILRAIGEEGAMYWMFVGVFTGIAFAWVSVRRRRKTGPKTA
jgi:hypothetical protein